MFDARIRKVIDPTLNKVGRALDSKDISANQVTATAFIVGLGAVAALAAENYTLALLLILFNRLGDGLDGAIARSHGTTDLGGYLDIVLDFIFYAAVVFGFALARPENAVAAAFLIFCFVGTGSSFLAYAIIAAKREISTEIRGKKTFYYLGGLTEGTETVAIFVAFCLFPLAFVPLAYIFGALCLVTTATRIYAACQTFR